ncbi:MAG: redoxin domain-containing protein [Candidatus Obscuribacterales bacterium]|nr:redoxin domain-containing protein [Candidatus Obscuribacterales bacterium]
MFETTVKAPPLTSGKGWLNVERPPTWDDLRGKVVLLDFWTFCCSDCMHILPYLEKLEGQFADELVVIGVHSGKFDNERSTDSIRQAMLRYGIKHPVVNDRSYALWEAFHVREWPTLVLVDPEGFIVKKVPCSEFPSGKFEEPIAALIEKFDAKGVLNRAPLSMLRREELESDSPLLFPGKITTNKERIFVSDTGNHRIVVADKQGNVTDVIGGNGAGKADGSFSATQFNKPQGICVRGNLLYIADTENHLIRCADLDKKAVSTVAGTGNQAAYQNGPWHGPALSVALSSPWDLACWSEFLIIAMAGTHQLWRMNIDDGNLELLAGTGFESLRDGPALEAQLSQPSGLSVFEDVLYFVDSETSSVRTLSLTQPAFPIRTLSGKGLFDFGDAEGTFEETRLQHPLGIAAGASELYVADSYNHKIKFFNLQTGLSQTLCGGKENALVLAEPGGLCKDGELLYVANTNQSEIRVISLTSQTSTKLEFKFPERHVFSLPNLVMERTLKKSFLANQPLTLTVRLSTESGIHFNEEMSCQYELRCETGDPIGLSQTGTLSKSVSVISLPQLDENVSVTLNFAFTAYVCGDDSACYVQSYRYFIPIETGVAHAETGIEIAEEIQLCN